MNAKRLSGFLALFIVCISLNSCNGEEQVFVDCLYGLDCPYEEEENAINPEEELMITEQQ